MMNEQCSCDLQTGCAGCLTCIMNAQVKHDDLKEAAQRFVEELSAGKEFIADHKPAQTEVLDAGIKTVQEELATLLGSLHEGLYVNADSPPADVVSALEQLQERLAQLKVRNLHQACCCAVLSGCDAHHDTPCLDLKGMASLYTRLPW